MPATASWESEMRERDSRPRSRAIIGVAIAAAVIIGVLALGTGAYFITSSAVVCASCHEMRPSVATWRVSPHAAVQCYDCHSTPRPWYRTPASLVERIGLLGRDVRAHWSWTKTEASTPSTLTAAAIPDSTCEHCHDPARTATSRFGILIKHAEHAKRNNSCVSCHRWTAHPSPTGDRDSMMMELCFKCHGLAQGSKAPGECAVCHLRGLDLHPDSHKKGDWTTRHGKVATTDREQCVMCHRDTFCRNCHGLEIPHPADWAKVHAGTAAQNREVCTKCHRGDANLCTMCHHKGYDGRQGPWVSQHFLMVRETGAAFCMQCHPGTFCVRCHAEGKTQ